MPIVSALAAVAARGYGFLQGRPSDFELIETQTVGAGGAANITFNSIPQTYKHLQIRYISKNSSTAAVDYAGVFARMNSDSGTNYKAHVLYTLGSGTPSSSDYPTETYARLGYSWFSHSSLASMFWPSVTDILDYANTSKYKTIRTLTGGDANASGFMGVRSSLWMSTAAISSIVLTDQGGSNFAQYSTFSLYGVK